MRLDKAKAIRILEIIPSKLILEWLESRECLEFCVWLRDYKGIYLSITLGGEESITDDQIVLINPVISINGFSPGIIDSNNAGN